jgi:hypothetical protein
VLACSVVCPRGLKPGSSWCALYAALKRRSSTVLSGFRDARQNGSVVLSGQQVPFVFARGRFLLKIDQEKACI